MISEVMIGKKRGCLVMIKSHFNLKEDMIISNLLQGIEIESSTDFIKLKNDKDVFFNPTSFYDYTPQQYDIEDDFIDSDLERFIPKSYLESAKLDLKFTSSVEVMNKVIDYREEEVVNFFLPKSSINEGNFNKRFYTALQTLVHNNLEASKEKCFNFLFSLNNKMNFKMDKVNFQNKFNTWWANVKDCGKYIDAPTTTKSIHFNPTALISKQQKKEITARIVGLKRSLNSIKRVYEFRQQNPTLKKIDVQKALDCSINTIRKYWETEPYNMEEEVMKINLIYLI